VLILLPSGIKFHGQVDVGDQVGAPVLTDDTVAMRRRRRGGTATFGPIP
jgi:hypothetical protein